MTDALLRLPPVPPNVGDPHVRRWLEQVRDSVLRFAATKAALEEAIAQMTSQSSIESTQNSSTSILSASATFTGVGELNGYNDVLITSKSDVAGTLYADFSPDGTNWDSTLTFACKAGTPEIHRLVKGYRYFRIRYVNGATDQSYFRLHCSFGNYGPLTAPRNLTAQRDADTIIARQTDHSLDVAQGFWSSTSARQKFGHNPSVSTTEEVIWRVGGDYTGWLTSATTIEAISSDATDNASEVGARQITVEGLDENFDEASETIAMNGTSATTATTTTFIRVHRAYVTEGGCGTYHGTNVGAITIRVSSAGATLAQIAAGRGQTELACVTVPAGYTMFIRNIRFNVDGGKPCTCFLNIYPMADDVSSPYSGKRTLLRAPGVDGQFDHTFTQYIEISEKSDVWLSARAAASTAAVAGAIDYYLVANS